MFSHTSSLLTISTLILLSSLSTSDNLYDHAATSTNNNNGFMSVVDAAIVPLQGIAYNPFRTDMTCQSKENIQNDLAILSRYAKSIRTYGMQCDQDIHILQAGLQYNVTVNLGLYVDSQQSTFDAQLALLTTLLKTANSSELSVLNSIIVGNEVISVGQQTPAQMVTKIQATRDLLRSFNLADRIQLTTAEILASYTDATLIKTVDYVLPNIHVVFSNLDISGAPAALFASYDTFQAQVNQISPNKRVVIGETGWPSGGAAPAISPKGVPSIESAQFFLTRFACEASKRSSAASNSNFSYFYFEMYNADWKVAITKESLEYNWGLGYSNRTVKTYVDKALDSANCDGASGGSGGSSTTTNSATVSATVSATSSGSGGGGVQSTSARTSSSAAYSFRSELAGGASGALGIIMTLIALLLPF